MVFKDLSLLEKVILLKRLKGGTAAAWLTVTGEAPLSLPNALAHAIQSLTQYGKVIQASTPTPSTPKDIVCNNGVIKYGALGQNLLDPSAANTVLGHYINKTDGEIKDSPYNFMFAGYMPVEPGKTYVAYGRAKNDNDLSDYNRVAWYDSTKTWIAGANYTQNQIAVVTAPENAAYARFSCNPSGGTTVPVTQKIVDSYNWMFAEGTAEITPFVPFVGGIYADGTPEVLTLAPSGSATQDGTPTPDNYVPVVGTKMGNTELFAIDTDADTYDPSTQTITRVIGKKVFNGTESFSKSTAYGNAFLVNAASSSWGADRAEAVLCTHFLGLPQSTGTQADNTCFFNQTGHFYFRVTDNSDANAFKSWLAEQYAAGTPVVVYFVCSSSTIEAYTGSPVGSTASVADLFAVGEYKDTHELISGTVTHKVGIKVLNGTESGWALSDSGSTHRFRGTKPSDCYTPASRAPSVSSHFKYVSTGSAVGGMFIGASQYWYFIPTDQTIDTVDEWETWLAAQYAQGTPVIVVYPLAAETTEQVTAQPLKTVKGDNAVAVVSNVDPVTLETIYKGVEAA